MILFRERAHSFGFPNSRGRPFATRPNIWFPKPSSASRNFSLRSISRPKSRRRYHHRKFLCDDSILNQSRVEFPRRRTNSGATQSVRVPNSPEPSAIDSVPVSRALPIFGTSAIRSRSFSRVNDPRTHSPLRPQSPAFEGSPTVTAYEPPPAVSRVQKLARIGCVRTVDEYSSRRFPAGLSALLRPHRFSIAARLPAHRPTSDAILDRSSCSHPHANDREHHPAFVFPAEHPRFLRQFPIAKNPNDRAFVFRSTTSPNQPTPGFPRENRSESLRRSVVPPERPLIDLDSVTLLEIDSHHPAFVFRPRPVSRTLSSPRSTLRSVARPARRSEIDERRGHPSPIRFHPPITWSPRPSMSPHPTSSAYATDQPHGPTPNPVSRAENQLAKSEDSARNRPDAGDKLSPTHHRRASSPATTNSSHGRPRVEPNNQLQIGCPIQNWPRSSPSESFPPHERSGIDTSELPRPYRSGIDFLPSYPGQKIDEIGSKNKVTQVERANFFEICSASSFPNTDHLSRVRRAPGFPNDRRSGFSAVIRFPEQRG
jgi:hypothetical protein